MTTNVERAELAQEQNGEAQTVETQAATEPASTKKAKTQGSKARKSTKTKAQSKTKAKDARKVKAEAPKTAREGSMAEFMDGLVQRTTDPQKLAQALSREAKRRGVKAPTLAMLRSHVRYRQARGHLQGVALPEIRKEAK